MVPEGAGYSATFAASATYTAKQYIHNSFGTVFLSYGTSRLNTRTSFAVASPHGRTAAVFGDNLTNNQPVILNNLALPPLIPLGCGRVRSDCRLTIVLSNSMFKEKRIVAATGLGSDFC